MAQARDCLDYSAKPHPLACEATEEERATPCAVLRAINFPLMTYLCQPFPAAPQSRQHLEQPQGIAEHLKAKPERANSTPHGRAGRCNTTKAGLIVETAKDNLTTIQPANGEPLFTKPRKPCETSRSGSTHK